MTDRDPAMNNLRAKAHKTALMRLKDRHEDEFRAIHEEVKQEMGVPMKRRFRTKAERIADLQAEIDRLQNVDN